MSAFAERMWDWAGQHPYLFTLLSILYVGSLRDNTFKAVTWMQDWWTSPKSTTISPTTPTK